MPNRLQKLVGQFLTKKAAGTILIVVAIVGLYGWVNSIEPDCYYSEGVGLQFRLCGEDLVGREYSANFWIPAAFLLVLVAGVMLRITTRANMDERSNTGAN